MICRRCGKNNPDDVQECIYCGTPLVMANGANNQKQTNNIMVALVIVLGVITLLLAIVTGLMIYKNNHSQNVVPDGGDSEVTYVTEDVMPSGKPVDDGAEKVIEEEIPGEEPMQTQAVNTENEKMSRKNAFLDRATSITVYAETYLDTAESQTEINKESGIVFEKWDDLLNEVYQYLKTILPDSEFKQLQQDEIAWIAEKENAIDAAGAEWEGGTGEPMVRNMTAISYTKDRCYYLIALIK